MGWNKSKPENKSIVDLNWSISIISMLVSKNSGEKITHAEKIMLDYEIK